MTLLYAFCPLHKVDAELTRKKADRGCFADTRGTRHEKDALNVSKTQTT